MITDVPNVYHCCCKIVVMTIKQYRLINGICFLEATFEEKGKRESADRVGWADEAGGGA